MTVGRVVFQTSGQTTNIGLESMHRFALLFKLYLIIFKQSPANNMHSSFCFFHLSGGRVILYRPELQEGHGEKQK